MDVQVLPANIKTVRVRVRRKGSTYMHAVVTFPPEIVKRYDIKDGEDVVICYLCRPSENAVKF